MEHTSDESTDNRINEISIEEAKAEIGVDGVSFLIELREWLYQLPSSHPLRIRIAPSPIIRSEADLFHVASPRFAYRVYLTDDERSFVNARRVERLLRSGPRWGKPDLNYSEIDGDYIYRHQAKTDLLERVKSSSCIADSLLSRPSWLSDERFRLLTVDLGAAYAERQTLAGTPFVSSVRIGPGLCAQAACFMSVLLCGSFTRAVHDFAEISCIGSERKFDDAGGITFAGMSSGQMIVYLNSDDVGLSAAHQGWTTAMSSDPEVNSIHSRAYFDLAVRAYVRSGFPVVYLVESDRLWHLKDRVGHTLRGSHTPPVPNQASQLMDNTHQSSTLSESKEHHAVVVIGYDAEPNESGEVEFVINDPSSLPFVKVSGTRLYECRLDSSNSSVGKRSLPGPWCILPVVPKPITVNLLDQRSPKSTCESGLVAWSLEVQANEQKLAAWGRNSPLADGSDFYLVSLKPELQQRLENQQPNARAAMTESAPVRNAIQCIREKAQESNGILPEWAWLEVIHDCVDSSTEWAVWIWDATRSLPRHPSEAESHSTQKLRDAIRDVSQHSLVAVIVSRDSKVGIVWNTIRPRTVDSDCHEVSERTDSDNRDANWKTAPRPAIRPALITSFSAKGIKEAINSWPSLPNGRGPDAEVYCFMEGDLKDLGEWFVQTSKMRKPLHPLPAEEAVQWMSRCCNEPEVVKSCAEFINYYICRVGISISGLASYFPHVTHEDAPASSGKNSSGQHGRQLAIQSLIFMARLARQLRDLGHQRLRTIEFVAGSRVTSIWPAVQEWQKSSNNSGTHYPKSVVRASYLSAEAARNRLLKTLERCVDSCRHELEGRGDDDTIRFALEIEPGQMFTIGSVPWAQALAETIQKSSLLRNLVSINLDLAHALLLKANDPAAFGDAVLKNIVNVHLSGQSSLFHFGDSSLKWYIASFSDAFDLRNWLHEISRNGNQAFRIDGVPVSIEFEAAKSRQIVQESVNTFAEWYQGW